MAGIVIEDALVTWIESLPAAIEVSAKVYPWAKAPKSTVTRPYVLFRRLSGGRIRSLTGTSGVSHPSIQLDFFGRDYTAVRALAKAVRDALDSFSGDMAGRTVQVALVDDDFDWTDERDAQPEHGTELAEHRFTLQAHIWFVE